MLVTFSYRPHFDRTCPLLLFADPLDSGRKRVSCNGGLRERRSGRQHPWKRGVSEGRCYGWSVMRHPCLFLNLVLSGSVTELLSSIFLIQKMWLIRWTSRASCKGHSTVRKYHLKSRWQCLRITVWEITQAGWGLPWAWIRYGKLKPVFCRTFPTWEGSSVTQEWLQLTLYQGRCCHRIWLVKIRFPSKLLMSGLVKLLRE